MVFLLVTSMRSQSGIDRDKMNVFRRATFHGTYITAVPFLTLFLLLECLSITGSSPNTD